MALIDAKWFRPNEYFRKDALFKAMFGILDVISDVMFSVNVTMRHLQGDTVPLFIVAICWATIIIPVLLSIMQLTTESRRA